MGDQIFSRIVPAAQGAAVATHTGHANPLLIVALISLDSSPRRPPTLLNTEHNHDKARCPTDGRAMTDSNDGNDGSAVHLLLLEVRARGPSEDRSEIRPEA